MIIQTFSRYEKKYLITKQQKNELIKRINKYLQYDDFCPNGSYYGIFNIYYDTKDNSLISESVKKPVYKEKLRLRSYKGICDNRDFVFLEIKKKSEGKVNKKRITLTYSQANKLIFDNISPEYPQSDYLNNQVLKEIEYMLSRHKLIPNYYIAYHRVAYFCVSDPSIRITFDNKIIERTTDINFMSVYGDEILSSDCFLMEIKVGTAFPLWLASALSDLKIYPRSFSKYGEAYKKNITKGERDVCLV